jgi:hypothetical protein
MPQISDAALNCVSLLQAVHKQADQIFPARLRLLRGCLRQCLGYRLRCGWCPILCDSTFVFGGKPSRYSLSFHAFSPPKTKRESSPQALSRHSSYLPIQNTNCSETLLQF